MTELFEQIAFIFLILISFLVKEGAERAFDRKDKTPRSKWSRLYHIMSLFVRIGLFLLLGLLTKHIPGIMKFIYLATFAFLAWPGYNITINLFRGDKWYYVGTDGIDRVIRKILFFVNFDKK